MRLRVALEVIDYPDASTFRARNYSIPYRAVVGAFRGDWITAAEQPAPGACASPGPFEAAGRWA